MNNFKNDARLQKTCMKNSEKIVQVFDPSCLKYFEKKKKIIDKRTQKKNVRIEKIFGNTLQRPENNENNDLEKF